MTNGEECHLFQVATTDRSHITMTPVPELRCNHEEADSRLLLYASHTAHCGSSTVVLMSPDSDVAVIAIVGSSRGLVVKVLDSKFKGCEFKTRTGHGSFSKLRQFRFVIPQALPLPKA